MGDFTPEAVEVQCPGCRSFFRIRPKGERVDDATVSCPKCFAYIPVETNRLPAGSAPSPDLSQADVAFNRIETRRAVAFPPDKTPATTMRPLPAHPLAADEADAINKLERLTLGTFTEPDTIRSTFSGFPGRTSDPPENPFQRNESTTSSSRSPLLQEFAALDEQEKQREEAGLTSLSDVHSEATKERKTPNLFPSKKQPAAHKPGSDAHLRQTSELGAFSAEQHKPASERPTLTSETQKAQIISKLKARLPLTTTQQADSSQNQAQKQDLEAALDPHTADTDSLEGATGILKADAIPEEYRAWADFPDDESLAADSTLDRTTLHNKPAITAAEENSDPAAEPSLAKLFKRARKRRATLPGDVLPKAEPAPKTEARKTQSKPALSVEITEDEVASILDSSTELSQSRIQLPINNRPTIPSINPATSTPTPVEPLPAAPKKSSVPPVPKAASKPMPSLKEKLSVTENSGIHDGLFAGIAPAPEKPPHPITHDSITVRPDRSGKTTSQSMLARLRQRRESMEIDAALASENRGSGFIRLPTAEIQQVLGRGTYRLLIENIVYEPVDKDGLIQLIKGGVLLGAEEIAEADGDWMPVSQHPVFEELRRRFAAEAHALLSRISSPREVESTERSQPINAPATSDVLISSPVFINETNEAPRAKSEPTAPAASSPDGPISEPLLAFSEEPNFALLSDSEVDNDPLPNDESDPRQTDSQEKTPAQEQAQNDKAGPAQSATPATSTPTADQLFDTAAESAPINQPRDAQPEPIAATQAVQDVEDDLELDEAPGKTRKKGKLLPVLLVLLLAICAATYFVTQNGIQNGKHTDSAPEKPSASPKLVAEPEKAPADLQMPPTPEAPTDQQAPAKEDLGGELSEEASAEQRVQEAVPAEIAGNSNTPEPYLRWQNSAKTPDESLAIARELLGQQNFRHARAIAAHGMATSDQTDEFRTIFQESIQSDADLHKSEPLDAVALFNINGIRIDQSAPTPHIILTRDGADRFIFKPAKSNSSDAWRSEIAAYRLCEMILCDFDIPHTAPAKILRADWERIAPDSELTAQMLWQSPADANGNPDTQFVYGALQELVPATTGWPIEITGLWRDWLGTAPTFNAISQDFQEAHARLENFGEGQLHRAILEHQNDITTRELAAQVSSLILFDFLTNNWERFSSNPAHYGQGTPFAQGTIISYNNGQTFQSRASRRVLGRFEWTGRFSRSTVAALRALTPELANSVLFDQPSTLERTRLDVFWSQHRQALSRIDASIERHGSELIFVFD